MFGGLGYLRGMDYTPFFTWYCAEVFCFGWQLLSFICCFYLLRGRDNGHVSKGLHLFNQIFLTCLATFFAGWNIGKLADMFGGYDSDAFKIYAYICAVPLSSIGLTLFTGALICSKESKVGRLVCVGISSLFFILAIVAGILALDKIGQLNVWALSASPTVLINTSFFFIFAGLNYALREMDVLVIVGYVLSGCQSVLALCCLVFAMIGLIDFGDKFGKMEVKMTTALMLYYGSLLCLGITYCSFTVMQVFTHVIRTSKKTMVASHETQPLMQGAPVVAQQPGYPAYQQQVVQTQQPYYQQQPQYAQQPQQVQYQQQQPQYVQPHAPVPVAMPQRDSPIGRIMFICALGTVAIAIGQIGLAFGLSWDPLS